MKRFTAPLLSIGLILAGLGLLYQAALQQVPVWVDGEVVRVNTRAFTVGAVLADGDIPVAAEDRLSPPASHVFFQAPPIRLDRAMPVQIWAGDQVQDLLSVERLPGNLLLHAGLRLFPGDRLAENGRFLSPGEPLQAGLAHTLQLYRAQPITLREGQTEQVFYSSAATLGQALWEAGVVLHPADRLTPAADTPLDGPLAVQIDRSVPLTITTREGTVSARSASATVGEALAEAGLALVGLDYSVPAETEPLPADGSIRVVRVQENIQLTQTLIPNESDYQPDPETELDHESVIDPGEPGIVVHRERVRFEDGVEVARYDEGEWTAREPRNRVVGYGTKVVVRKEVVNGVEIEYWRKLTVYATSYSPCRVGTGKCDFGSASGLPVQRGLVAVRLAWYRDMKFQQVYIPGYGKGQVGDVGGGIPGRYWVDLAFSEEDYESWHYWTTLYFLTPVPPYIPYILYP